MLCKKGIFSHFAVNYTTNLTNIFFVENPLLRGIHVVFAYSHILYIWHVQIK